MAERPKWVPGDIDLERPSVARVYDYWLGGAHNFAADRAVANRTLEAMPELRRVILTNRTLLRRMVRHLLRLGVRQFLDLGSGIPTAGNVHEIAHAVDPTARVVYVDMDPVAIAHGKSLLADLPNVVALQADIRDPASVLGDPEVRSVLDLDQPVAVLMIAVLHFVPDADHPCGIIADYLDALVPGSYLGVSHSGGEQGEESAAVAEARRRYSEQVAPMVHRTRAELISLLGGLELVEPGVVRLPHWRPDSPDDVDESADRFPGFAALGRKP
ncbi:SAM-dependent methyltransferase [Umezawaea tangerina]|uniref:S-adenosyl methyltransferase n=1 Tax=Umezawaea tangerina TaxID=84725 RepID=A0A2T0SH10_9PSEU|nr:SAM-dependent methyltransferase [Umezawaea tangerina]PRY32698.1 S-adenosyl methyltransferase [Umezawaea tangerina]